MDDAGKLDAAKSAARQVVSSMESSDSAAVISFGDSAQVVQGMTSDKNALSAAIGSLQAGGNTALYDAIGKTTLLAEALPQPLKVQLIVTDGTDTTSSTKLNDVLNGIRDSRSLVYVVGIGDDVDRSVLDQIAQAGNGQALYTDDPSELGTNIQSILDRLRLAYVLRYATPATSTSDKAHTVAVTTTYQGQVTQAVSTFTAPTDTVAVDVGGVTPGEMVTGDRQVRATVRSGSPQRLDLLVDGTTVASSAGQPSTLVGDLTRMQPGDHDLALRAADSQGNLTVQHVPFTVAAPATPAPVAAPEATAEPTTQPAQPAPVEEPAWLWWLLGLLVLATLVVYLVWWLRARTARKSPAAAATSARDDATLELDAPDESLAIADDAPRLRVDSQGQQQDVALTEAGAVSIGRDADNTVVLRDLHVSRHHARITFDDAAYWIEDLKSQNGTLLNGHTPIDRRRLERGDQFAIGSATITYLDAAMSDPAVAEDGNLRDAAPEPPVAAAT
jgi:hypothetical protein